MYCQYAAASRKTSGACVIRMLWLPGVPQLIATYRYQVLRRATPVVLDRSLPLTSAVEGFRVLLLDRRGRVARLREKRQSGSQPGRAATLSRLVPVLRCL